MYKLFALAVVTFGALALIAALAHSPVTLPACGLLLISGVAARYFYKTEIDFTQGENCVRTHVSETQARAHI